MAKKIKFPLEMANEVKVRTLEELRDNFDLNKAIGYFLDGKLVGWLEDRYYENECEQLAKLDKNDSQLYQKLCGILGVEYQVQEEVDLEEMELRNQKIAKLKQYTDDASLLDKVDIVAFNQEDLADLIDAGEGVIYLCESKFTIPLKILHKEYIGIGEVEVNINSKEKVDFDNLGIKFSNVHFNLEYTHLIQNTPEELYNIAYDAANEQNYIKALEYYKKSADMGNASAMLDIGLLYDCGHGVNQNYQVAMEWYQKAATFNNDIAMRNIGIMYHNGQGVEQNYQIAMEWYQKAATFNNTAAMKNIGNLYHNGQGVEQNYQIAMEWYQKAATFNNAAAMSNIGDLYYNGQGVDQNYQVAMEWYKKASDLGNIYANYLLGWLYEFGQGTSKNMQLAQEYYKKASDGGYSSTNLRYDPTYRYGYNLLFFYNNLEDCKKWFLEHYNAHNLMSSIDSIISGIRNLKKKTNLFWVDISAFYKPRSEILSETRKKIQQARSKLYDELKEDISSYCEEIKQKYLDYLIATAVAGVLDNTLLSDKNRVIEAIENQLLLMHRNFALPDPTELIISEIELTDTSDGGFFATKTYMIENWSELGKILDNEIKPELQQYENYIFNYIRNITDGWADELERIKISV